jgi:hypothetical protein
VRRDRFCFAGALEDEELREDGDGLEEDGEGPEDLCQVEGVVEEDPEEERGAEEVLDAEGVDGRVMRWPVALRGVERGTEPSTLDESVERKKGSTGGSETHRKRTFMRYKM